MPSLLSSIIDPRVDKTLALPPRSQGILARIPTRRPTVSRALATLKTGGNQFQRPVLTCIQGAYVFIYVGQRSDIGIARDSSGGSGE